MAYANIDPAMWDDPYFYTLPAADGSRDAQILWFYMLTGPEAVHGVPGLIQTSVSGLADALRMESHPCDEACRVLLERELIEVDLQSRLIRIPGAPAHRRPGNPNVLLGWHRRWRNLPKSPLKYAHISSIHESLEQLSPKVKRMFADTFGKEPIPDGMIDATESLSKAFPDQLNLVSADVADLKAFESLSYKASESLLSGSVVRDPDQRSGSGSEGAKGFAKDVASIPRIPEVTNADTVPAQVPEEPPTPPPPPATVADAQQLWKRQEELRSLLPGAPPSRGEPMPGELQPILVALSEFSPVQLEHALRVDAAKAAESDRERTFFNGKSNWHPKHLQFVVNQAIPSGKGHSQVHGRQTYAGGQVL